MDARVRAALVVAAQAGDRSQAPAQGAVLMASGYVTVERYNSDAYRLIADGKIVGFALRMSDGRWGLFDPDDNRIGKLAYKVPKDAAADMERKLAMVRG